MFERHISSKQQNYNFRSLNLKFIFDGTQTITLLIVYYKYGFASNLFESYSKESTYIINVVDRNSINSKTSE